MVQAVSLIRRDSSRVEGTLRSAFSMDASSSAMLEMIVKSTFRATLISALEGPLVPIALISPATGTNLFQCVTTPTRDESPLSVDSVEKLDCASRFVALTRPMTWRLSPFFRLEPGTDARLPC